MDLYEILQGSIYVYMDLFFCFLIKRSSENVSQKKVLIIGKLALSPQTYTRTHTHTHTHAYTYTNTQVKGVN